MSQQLKNGKTSRVKKTTVIQSNTETELLPQPQPQPQSTSPPQIDEFLDKIPLPQKKSRKKQFTVIASVGPNGIQGNLQPEVRKPLIAHLPIQSRDLNSGAIFNSISYDPNPPPAIQPFDSEELNAFSDHQAQWDEQGGKQLEQADTILQSAAISQTNQDGNVGIQNMDSLSSKQSKTDEHINYNKEHTLLIQYANSKETQTLPEKSDAACQWCCHTFENTPCVLPYRDLGTHLLVNGNFCSPECAMAYLFDNRVDSHTRWEQMSLLHRVYSEAVGGKIYPAPSKMVLKMFGGPMTIEDYRDNIRSHKYRVDIHVPPMVSILATMDTKPIDFYDASLIKTILDTAQERVAKAEEVLRLKRTKPLKAWESTLDACMNLRVSSVRPVVTGSIEM